MSLSIGIVGLPNVGKSTLFNALLKRQAALAANYPFATIEPNVGVVDVPDDRLGVLAAIVKKDYGSRIGDREVPERIVPAVIKFYDIAGLVKGASEGEGLGNEFLGHIREVDALVHVVRDFDDVNVIRAGAVAPESDIDVINTELLLSDLQAVQKRLDKLSKELKTDRTPELKEKYEIFTKVRNELGHGVQARDIKLSEEEAEYLWDSNLLTLKPIIIVFNVSDDMMNTYSTHININAGQYPLYISAKIESDIASIESAAERAEFMEAMGLKESGLDKIIKKGFEILGLEVFLTMGPKEVRAWTIKKGTKAPQAAGVIHSDFERGFISAEVVSYEDLKNTGSLKIAKDRGLIRLEGKSYTMKDGDVVEFNFSV